MADTGSSGVYQYPQPRVPETWTGERKQFVVWLTEVLDDIYKRYGRLDFSDFSQQVRDWIAGMNDWPDSLRGEFDASLADLAANLTGNIEQVNSLVLTLEQIQNGTIADVADLLAQLANTDAHIISVEQTINVIEGEVSTKVSESDFFALAGQVNQNSTEISQNAYEINLKADETYVDTLNGIIQQSGALLQILKTMIGAQVYEVTYNSGPISSGPVFPMTAQENEGFIYTGGDIPRFYVYKNGDWYEQAAQHILTSGVVIEPGHVAISTPNLQFQLTDPVKPGVVLVGIDQNGMRFQDKNGNLVFNFDVDKGSLSIAGIIYATGGVIGGFQIGGNTLSKGDFVINSDGSIRIGPSSSPYFEVNQLSTTIGNALYIKPGTLPVTDARPNLYYDATTGKVFRTTWAGSGVSLSAVLNVTPSAITLGSGTQFLVNWTVSGGTPGYTIAWAYKNSSGTTISSGSGTAPSYQFYLTPSTAGGFFFQLSVTDSEGAVASATYNVTVAAEPVQQPLSATLSYSGYCSASGGSGNYSYRWYVAAIQTMSWVDYYGGYTSYSSFYQNQGGQMAVYCQVRDNSTGQTTSTGIITM